MREIVFKAKRLDSGEWVYGNLVKAELLDGSGFEYVIIEVKAEGKTHNIDSSTICQYTGLTDKNDQKFWENDICKGKYWENGISHRLIGKVDYVYGKYLVCGVKQYLGFHSELNGAYEIIGNIFDNPELLKGGD